MVDTPEPDGETTIGGAAKYREINIDSWLDEHYPGDESLRWLFKEIYRLGGHVVDFDYIHLLCSFVNRGDEMRRLSQERGTQRLSEALGPPDDLTDPANPPKIPNHKENADRWNAHWGNIFLVAITEHLNETTNDPRQELTWTLFTALHKHSKPNSISNVKHHVADRIRRYKKNHNWQDEIAYLKRAALSILREKTDHRK